MNLSKRSKDKELFSGERSSKENTIRDIIQYKRIYFRTLFSSK